MATIEHEHPGVSILATLDQRQHMPGPMPSVELAYQTQWLRDLNTQKVMTHLEESRAVLWNRIENSVVSKVDIDNVFMMIVQARTLRVVLATFQEGKNKLTP